MLLRSYCQNGGKCIHQLQLMSIEDSKPSYIFDPVTWKWMMEPAGRNANRMLLQNSVQDPWVWKACGTGWTSEIGKILLNRLSMSSKPLWLKQDQPENASRFGHFILYWVSNVRVWKSNAGLQHASAYFVLDARRPEMSTWIYTSIASPSPLSPLLYDCGCASVATFYKLQKPLASIPRISTIQ